MSTATKIRALRRELGFSQVEVSKAIGVDRSAIAQWENDISQPRMGNVRRLAAFFGVPVSVILDDTEIPELSKATIALHTFGGHLTNPHFAEEICGGLIEIPKFVLASHPAARAALIDGDYMNRVIPEGVIVVYDPALKPLNGQIVIAETEDGEVLMRRWYKVGNTIVLVADSFSAYDDIVVHPDSAIQLIGTVVWMQGPLDSCVGRE